MATGQLVPANEWSICEHARAHVFTQLFILFVAFFTPSLRVFVQFDARTHRKRTDVNDDHCDGDTDTHTYAENCIPNVNANAKCAWVSHMHHFEITHRISFEAKEERNIARASAYFQSEALHMPTSIILIYFIGYENDTVAATVQPATAATTTTGKTTIDCTMCSCGAFDSCHLLLNFSFVVSN